MTEQERNDYKWKWHRFETRYERIYTVKFKAALQTQVRQFQRHKDTLYITSEPIHKVLTSLYKEVGTLWAARTGIHRLKNMQVKERLPMGFSERIVELMRRYYGVDLLNEAELITADSRKMIGKILSDAAMSGASFDEIVREILKSPDFNAMRARRIARTEIVTSANGAAQINAKESGLKMKKEWIAITDARTRHSHKDVDGTIIDIDEPYNVNGSLMMQPGVRTQTNGLPTPASETVNCRCTQGFIAQRDSRGRLIRS